MSSRPRGIGKSEVLEEDDDDASAVVTEMMATRASVASVTMMAKYLSLVGCWMATTGYTS